MSIQNALRFDYAVWSNTYRPGGVPQITPRVCPLQVIEVRIQGILIVVAQLTVVVVILVTETCASVTQARTVLTNT